MWWTDVDVEKSPIHDPKDRQLIKTYISAKAGDLLCLAVQHHVLGEDEIADRYYLQAYILMKVLCNPPARWWNKLWLWIRE